MIFQDPFGALNPSYTVEYHLRRSLANLRPNLTAREQTDAVLEMLDLVGLRPNRDYLKKKPHELSGGQRQRVVIAQAMLVNPEVVVADEPTSVLDVSLRVGILNLMDRLRQDKGTAFLFITHDLASARYLADDLYVMYAGQFVEHGPAAEMIHHPLPLYTRILLDAVPDPRRRTLAVVSSNKTVADLTNASRGCRFAPRCPVVQDVCWPLEPEEIKTAENHAVRCHQYDHGM